MPALTGEPWRGLAKIQLDGGLGNRRNYTVSIDDVVPDTATGDQTTWEGAAGASVTLRLEWDAIGVPAFGAADTALVQARLPGGAAVGSDWNPVPAGNSGSLTRTLHFDSDPLNQLDDPDRWGMLEVFLQVQRAAAIAWGPVDSRGGGSPPAATTLNWARGYLRARGTISSHSVSNVSLGGAEPASWAFPDSVFSRFGFQEQAYENFSLDYQVRRTGLATVEREETLSAAGPNRDFSWTGTTGTNRRIGNGMQLGSEGKDLYLNLTAADFGGDNKYVWATTGHEANWTRDSDLVLHRDNRITVDPRITIAHLEKMNARTFDTPPLPDSDDDSRITTDLAFQSARFRNARGEGQNILTLTGKNWDAGELTGSESAPTNQITSVATAAEGGEAGWAQTTNQLPLVWDESLPGGNWTIKWIITAPSDATGLESGATRTVSLLAANPDLRVICGGGASTVLSAHFQTGKLLLVGASMLNTNTRQRTVPDASPAPSAIILRLNVSTGLAEYLDSVGAWQSFSGTADSHTLTETVADSRVFTKSFSAAVTSGASWNDADVFLIGKMFQNGVPYTGFIQLAVTGASNQHDGYSLDALGFALSGVLSQK